MYTKIMTAGTPGCIILLLDQSGSMSEPFGGASGAQKDRTSADAANHALRQLVRKCQLGDVIRPRCDVGVIGYGTDEGGKPIVGSVLGGALRGCELVPIPHLADAPLYERPAPSGADPEPVWVEPRSQGGTPMAEALEMATSWAQCWVAQHRDSFPPIVINVTDGEPSDEAAAVDSAMRARRVETSDGSLLLMNVHVSSTSAPSTKLPSHDGGLPDAFARLLFQMSSVMPDTMVSAARSAHFTPSPQARAYVYNSDAETLARAIVFGTSPVLR